MKLVNALEQFAWTQKPSSSSPPTATQAINPILDSAGDASGARRAAGGYA